MLGLTLIEAWYEVMDTDKFSDLHPVNEEVSIVEAIEYMQAHYGWIHQADIAKTSTTFMNGYELPAAYRVRDLVPLIPVLDDIFGHMNGQNSMKENVSSDQIEEKKTNV